MSKFCPGDLVRLSDLNRELWLVDVPTYDTRGRSYVGGFSERQIAVVVSVVLAEKTEWVQLLTSTGSFGFSTIKANLTNLGPDRFKFTTTLEAG